MVVAVRAAPQTGLEQLEVPFGPGPELKGGTQTRPLTQQHSHGEASVLSRFLTGFRRGDSCFMALRPAPGISSAG